MTDEPRRLGPYVLHERLGAGGMGAVHRAVHVETGAVHALKVIASADAGDVLRFQREGQAMALIDGHPHVLRVHAAGHDAGRVWIAMELAEGGSLAERLARGPLPPLEAASLMRAVALGLAHVHARGVIHRDLKPANVLLDRDGAPRLADWGLARVRGAAALTTTGEVLGTPAYMAPEQARGDKVIDERADVYGAGAVLFHALTGRPPFEGASLIGVLEQVLTTPPPRPRALAPDVPAWLEEVCLRALAKAPADRQPDARALAEALAGPPAAAARVPRGLALAAGAALVLGAVALVVADSPRTAPPSPAPTRAAPAPAAAPPFDPTAFDALLAQDAREALAMAEAAIARSGATARVGAAEAALALGQAERAAAHAEAARAATEPRSPTHAAARWALGRALLLAGDPGGAADHLMSSAVRALTGGRSEQLADLERLRVELSASMAVKHAIERDAAPDFPSFIASLQRFGATQPGAVYPPLGSLGRTLGARLQTTLLDRSGDLKLMRGMGLIANADVIPALVAARDAAPGTREARCLEVVASCFEVDLHVGAPKDAATLGRLRALHESLEAALRDPLPEPYARLAAAASMAGLLASGGDGAPFLERAVKVVQSPVAPDDPQYETFASHRAMIIDFVFQRAWQDGARRAELVERGLSLCDTQGDFLSRPCSPRARCLLRLLSHQPVLEEDLQQLEPDLRLLFQAEGLAASGELQAALRRYRELEQAERRRGPLGNVLIDALAGQALMVAALRDRAEATRLAREIRGADRGPWLPWRSIGCLEASIALALEGAWTPGRDEAYPPSIAPR
jgi:hypothetical protein